MNLFDVINFQVFMQVTVRPTFLLAVLGDVVVFAVVVGMCDCCDISFFWEEPGPSLKK